jgi:hypothetical protein
VDPAARRKTCLAVVVTLALAPPSTAAAAVRRGVFVQRVSAPPAAVIVGARFRVVDVTRNGAAGPSPPADTVYLASPGRGPGPGAIELGRRTVPRLAPGRGSRRLSFAAVPVTARPGRYRLVACAGVHGRPGGFDPRACRVSPRQFRILPQSPTDGSRPAIAGVALDGRQLLARPGHWFGVAPLSYAYHWQRCDSKGARCRDVPAEGGPAYTVIPADIGKRIRLLVTATNPRGSATATAPPTAPIQPAPPASTSPPTVTGRAVAGESISAGAGTWSGTPPLAFAYSWERCNLFGVQCRPIAGATRPAYAPAAGDAGSTLRVRVTATNRRGRSVADSGPIQAGLWENPVYGSSAPDPFVLDVGGAHDDYWEFNTGGLFPMLHSSDLIHWTPAGHALPDRPAWVANVPDWHPWAPAVTQTPQACPGAAAPPCFVMHYTAVARDSGLNCIGVATATAPGGPYTDRGPLQQAGATGQPIGCGDSTGQGAIDPSPFVDSDGNAYLYVSTDYVIAHGQPQLKPTISVIPLSPDLLWAAGPRTALFSGDPGTWEIFGRFVPTVEGPAMVKRGGIYYLLYSGGYWTSAYGMGYATSTSPTGPFTKAVTNPILFQGDSVLSPGGADVPVVGPHGGTWLVYHGRDAPFPAARELRIDSLQWVPGAGGGPDVPTVVPTQAAQPSLP